MALIVKCFDTMKISRDSGTITNAQKIEHVNAIVLLVPDITHITVDCYLNNFGYQSVAYIKEWFDAIHNAGKSVLFRPALAGGGYTPETLTDECVEAAQNLATCWATTGDLWDVIPESNPVGSTFSGDPAIWNEWVRDTITALNAEFASQSKTVDVTFFSGTDQQAIFNTRVESATVDVTGKICIDFYPMDYIGSFPKGSTVAKVNNLITQVKLARTNYPTADIYITETGYNNTGVVTDEDQREVIRTMCNALSALSYFKGFNYWVSYGVIANNDNTRAFVNGSRTSPRAMVAVLKDYYKNGSCVERLAVL